MDNRILVAGNNVEDIVKSDLCCGCGFCFSICPHQCIQLCIDDDIGQYRPSIYREDCSHCQLCVSICPGADEDWLSTSPDSWPQTHQYNFRLGYYTQLFVGCSTNKSINHNGSSGGAVTEILIYMLENGFIDGVVTTVMRENEPLTAKPFIAETPKQICHAQQSKYCPVPFGTILKAIKFRPGRYAVVALPCCVNAIRKIQKIDSSVKERIPYVIGLFCSRTPSFHATKYILKKRNIAIENVLKIDYRGGSGHIGHMKIQLKNNQIVRVPHLHFDYWGYMFSKFFLPARCYLCTDKTAASADISLGDNWSKKMKRHDGTSTLIVRSSPMVSIIDEMRQKNYLALEPIDKGTIINSQDLVRKQSIEPRRIWWSFAGGRLPRYNQNLAQKAGIIRIVKSLPDFIQFFFSRRRRNTFLLGIIARISWILELLVKSSDRILALTVKGLSEIFKILMALFPVRKCYFTKMAPTKIVIIGGYGSKDIGDESMPHSDIIHFRKRLGEKLEILMLSVNPDYTSEYHRERSAADIKSIGMTSESGLTNKIYNILAGVRMVVFLFGTYLFANDIHIRLWPSAFNALREIASADLVFNVGGGNLNSIIPQEFYKKGITYIAARILDKPVVVSGQTIGPFSTIADRLFARYVLNKPQMITFRDKEISYRRCRKIGVKKPVLLDTADDAMTLPYFKKNEAMALLDTDPGVCPEWTVRKAELTICMNLKGSLRIFRNRGKSVDLSEMIYKFSQLVELLLENFDSKIILIPTDFHPDVDDRNLHREVIGSICHNDRIARLENEYNDIALKSLINLCDVAIGARYHFCVFACSLHKPFLGVASGIYQMTKLKGLALLNGLPHCFYEHDLESANLEDLFMRAKSIITRREELSLQLKTSVPELKKRSETAINFAIKLLEQSSTL
jgi:coenzyme F420-reducing hydrogenase beta subunit/polysaccharide pyruvyl transferase WcaK-like protein